MDKTEDAHHSRARLREEIAALEAQPICADGKGR